MSLVLLLIAATVVWVGFDATGRDWSRSRIAKGPFGWMVLTALLWLIFFPAYLAARQRAPLPYE